MPCYDDRAHPRHHNSFSDAHPPKPISEADALKRAEGEIISQYQKQLEEQSRNLEATYRGQINWLEAALCLMTSRFYIKIESAGHDGFGGYFGPIAVSLEDHLDGITEAQWKEAGIQAADLREWRQVHDIKDEARRQAEAASSKEAQRAAAMAKLTPEDREVLGL